MTAPVHLRREPPPGMFPAHIQGASPFRAIYFMSAESHQVDTILIHIYRDLAHRLSGIREEDHPMLPGDPADFPDRLDHTDLVIGAHNGNENGSGFDTRLQFRRIDQSLRADR